MTRRDHAWRLGGLALTVGASTACLSLDRSPLMIHGKRVAQVLRAERRGHALTAGAVHAARRRARGQNSDGFGT